MKYANEAMQESDTLKKNPGNSLHHLPSFMQMRYSLSILCKNNCWMSFKVKWRGRSSPTGSFRAVLALHPLNHRPPISVQVNPIFFSLNGIISFAGLPLIAWLLLGKRGHCIWLAVKSKNMYFPISFSFSFSFTPLFSCKTNYYLEKSPEQLKWNQPHRGINTAEAGQ